jgi:hypothetical protein
LSVDNTPLSFQQSFARAKADLIGGLYLFLFFPCLQICGAWRARRLGWIGQTKWDAAGGFYVYCKNIGVFREWFAYSISFALLTTIILATKLAQEITREQIREAVITNVDR